MFKLSFSAKAMDYIYKKNNKITSELDKLVVAMFYYSENTWTTYFCGNVLELVEKHKILSDKEEFIKWANFDGIPPNDPYLKVYIEKSLID